eukprot:5355655-Pleurochrysis_carterae.AAC.1
MRGRSRDLSPDRTRDRLRLRSQWRWRAACAPLGALREVDPGELHRELIADGLDLEKKRLPQRPQLQTHAGANSRAAAS